MKNENEENEGSEFLGETSRKLIYGKHIACFLPPNAKNIWENEVKEISEELNLPIGWNGKKNDDTSSLAEIIFIGCYLYKNFIPIANRLGVDKVSFIKELGIETVDNVVDKYEKHPELIEKTDEIHKEVTKNFSSGLILKIKKIATKKTEH